MAAADTGDAGFDERRLARAAADADAVYESLKAELLQAAAKGRLAMSGMEAHIENIGRMHRAAERAVKAAQRIAPLRARR